jgi:hypothetical protein
VGFPIRKSADQSSFAAPRGLSQRTTSFIASQRQGIHQIPFRHLIALIVDAHPSAEVSLRTFELLRDKHANRYGIDAFSFFLCFREKTSLLHANHPMMWVSHAGAFATLARLEREPTIKRASERDRARTFGWFALFTMSCSRIARQNYQAAGRNFSFGRVAPVSEMVEPDGIEPTTSCLQSRRSPN